MDPLLLVAGGFVAFTLGLVLHPGFFAVAVVFAALYAIDCLMFLLGR